MLPLLRSSCRLIFAFVVVLSSARSFAQVTVTPAGVQDSSVYPVSNTDLLQTNLGSSGISGGYSSFGSNSLATLYDGNFGTAGNDFAGSVSFAAGAAVTLMFNLTTSPAGYDLTSIKTYSNWDAGRDGQEYSVAYSTAATPGTFVALANAGPFDVTGNVPAGPTGRTLITIADLLGGTLVGGVAGLRFTFTSYENGGTAYREFDVVGSPTAIPEPAWAGLALGLAGLLRFLRRARAARCE